MSKDSKKLTEEASLLAFYFSKAGYQLAKIFKSINKSASKSLLNEATLAQLGGMVF